MLVMEAASELRPSWKRHDKNILLSYELPHRIHTTLAYPLNSPNGSNIIIYGHDDGLTVLWRGGRALKQSQTTTQQTQSTNQHETVNQDITTIDSDDEWPLRGAESSGDDDEDIEYDSEEEEFDSTTPFEPVVAQLSIKLGKAVLHIAAPSFPNEHSSAFSSIPASLSQKVVVTVSCSDSSVRLISFNLRPSRKAKHVETLLDTKPNGIGLLPRGVSITWTLDRPYKLASDVDNPDHLTQNTELEPSEGRRAFNNSVQSPSEEDSCDLLVASHSSDVTGMLFIWRLPIPGGKISRKPVLPIQTQFLPTSATTIAFNKSSYPSRYHSHLLVADCRGLIRIYNPLPLVGLRTQRSTDRSVGTWLATFCVPFRENGSRRLNVLDVHWALNGRCILVLLENGEWGIWDIEGVGPDPDASSLRERSTMAGRGVVGGGLTNFALHGFIGDDLGSGRSSTLSQDTNKSSTLADASRLAPMTPKTRKVKQENLFHGPSQTARPAGFVSGGISLLPIARTLGGGKNDESVLFWFGTGVYSMPSLMTYWQRVAARRSPRHTDLLQGGTLYGPTITQVTSLSTSGEMITSLSQLPICGDSTTIRPGVLQHTILLSAEHRLVMLTVPKTSGAISSATKAASRTNVVAPQDLVSERVDQHLLSKESLDLDGMNRRLDGMARGKPLFGNVKTSGFATHGRKVGFAAGY